MRRLVVSSGSRQVVVSSPEPDMPSSLPDFEGPPVVEVAMGVQFEPLPLTAAHLGLLWQKYRDRLPLLEERPPLDQVVERFGVRQRPPRSKITLFEQAPPTRLWLSSESGDELVQVQRDRFIFNWRKGEDDREYPRYEAVARNFRSTFATFSAFLKEQDAPVPKPTQCEVTYINHILPVDGVWTSHAEAAKAVTLVGAARGSFLPDPEDVRVAARFIIKDSGGSPVGRLHAVVEPRFLVRDDRPLLFLQLTARGRPLGEGLDGAEAFIDLGREWIVNGFLDVTTPEMHSVWGRR